MIIEELLEVEELNFFTLSDGLTLRTLPLAQVGVFEGLLPLSRCFPSLETSFSSKDMHYNSTVTRKQKY